MSTRGRLARLERLERLKQKSHPDFSCPDFVIAPELALAIVDAYSRLSQLLSRYYWYALSCKYPGKNGESGDNTPRPDPPAEEEAPRAWLSCCGTCAVPRTTGRNRPTRIEGTSIDST
jgi:hypothetical protein